MTTLHRRIDHAVVAVRDLDAAGALYRRLGFQVGARNRHPWGTENRLIQFGTAFIELITVADGAAIPPHGPGRFSFGAFVAEALARREGFAMLVLDSADAAADAARFAGAGIGPFEPFHFARSGLRPDGTETRVAFTLAFAASEALPEAGFFVCQQHVPENFWNPAFQVHPNGATAIVAATLAAPDPAGTVPFLEAFSGARAATDGAGAVRLPLAADGAIAVVRRDGPAAFTGLTIAVADLGAVGRLLADAGLRFDAAPDRLTLAPGDVHGVALAFVPRPAAG